MTGVFAESLLRKQAWRNRKKGRVSCLHQNIFTMKVTEIAYMAIIIHIPRPPSPCIWRPRVPYLMSSGPSSRVPRSQVPTHASRCPRPLVPVPLLYTATLSWHFTYRKLNSHGCIYRLNLAAKKKKNTERRAGLRFDRIHKKLNYPKRFTDNI